MQPVIGAYGRCAALVNRRGLRGGTAAGGDAPLSTVLPWLYSMKEAHSCMLMLVMHRPADGERV